MADTPTTVDDNATVRFDQTFLRGNSIDVGRFERGNVVLPGTYTVELYVNDRRVARRDVRFVSQQGSASAQPCLTWSLLQAGGVDTRQLGFAVGGPQEGRSEKPGAEECIDLSHRIPDAAVHYDASEQQLTLSIPQAALRRTARGEVDPSLWSDGIPAGLFRYDANIYRTQGNGSGNDSAYLGLMTGGNLGGWRLRQRSSLNYSKYRETRYEDDDISQSHRGKKSRTSLELKSIEAYAQHDLTAWKSTFTVGDSITPGELFDSFSLRGIQLGSDDRMYPNSLRGYAPVLHGVARSNAKVEVRQNGNVIYQTTVAPGAFTIDDLYPTGYGGDLEVVVTEADGGRQTFSAPYASVPQLLRPGRSRYSIAFGQYRSQYEGGEKPYVGELTYQRGLSDLFTGYTGALVSDNYAAALVGTALNTYWGAFALDLTTARAQLSDHVNRTGQSVRLSYAKILPQTDTPLSLAAYRYSTSGYYSFNDAVQARQAADSGSGTGWYDDDYRARDRLQVNVSQRIGSSSSLYAMGMMTGYWADRPSDTQFQVGYSTGFSWGQVGLPVQRTRNGYGEQDNQIYANLTVPFGRQAGQSPLFSSSTTSVTENSQGDTTLQTSVSGSGGANNAWSYGLNGNYGSQSDDRTTSLGGNASYTGGQGSVGISASTGAGVTQYSLSGSGSMIVHSGGVTFGQAMSPDAAVALVKADGAAGAAVTNASGVVVDGRGYAVVPNLTPYQVNTLDLDPQNVSDDVELESTSQDVVPRAGAVVLATFETKRGKPLILHIRKADGEVVPMGTDVLLIEHLEGSEMKRSYDLMHTVQLLGKPGVVKRTTLWRIAVVAFSLGWASAASALSCEGSKPESVVPGPASITVSPAAPAGTSLTGWLDGTPDEGLNHCVAGVGYAWYSMQVQYAGSGIDTGIRVFRDGAVVPVISTNIDGVGIAIAARVAFDGIGWKPWMQGIGYPSNNFLSAAEEYSSSSVPRQGGQGSYQLVKTRNGFVNAGEVLSIYSKVSEAPVGPHNPQPSGGWSTQWFTLAPIRIVPLTCNTHDVNVNMGNVALRAFHGPGSTAGRKAFSIPLTNCPAGIQSIDYTLDPVTQIIDSDRGVIALKARGATGVGVQLLDATGQPVPLQRPMRFSGYIPGSASADIPLQAAYYQTASAITPGNADAAVRFTITYQ